MMARSNNRQFNPSVFKFLTGEFMRRTRYASFLFAFFMAVSAFGRHLPNIDKLGEQRPSPTNSAALAQKTQAFKKGGLPTEGEPRLGVPTFVWGSQLPTVVPAFKPGSTATPLEA